MSVVPSTVAMRILGDAPEQRRETNQPRTKGWMAGKKLQPTCGARRTAPRDGSERKDFPSFAIRMPSVQRCTPTGTKSISGGREGEQEVAECLVSATNESVTGEGLSRTKGLAARDITQVLDQELGIEPFPRSGQHDFIEALLRAARIEFLPQEVTSGCSPARAKALVHTVLDLAGHYVSEDKALKIDGT